ncbi:MAG: tRNA dimethylallyltransferase [Clostridiales bacterium]|jgi:tRNA dimethylallyltransferase|nr:tRNA dimethylallyltransferase [Clostridiales bacterium]
MRRVIFIVGPTAVGKTDTAVGLAKALDGEVVSADSMQIYRELNIGSAKPTTEEMDGIVHHMIDVVAPEATFSVSAYAQAAHAAINDIFARGKQPIVAGGTGLYVNALLYDMSFGEGEADEKYRAELEALVLEQGGEALYERLKAVDPGAAERIHPNNVRRVMRALEIYRMTGTSVPDFSEAPKRHERFESVLIGLTRDREALYDRINRRVDIMLENGLIEEVKNLKKNGITDRNQSMQGIGYKEVSGFLDGCYDKATMVTLLKRNSRRYAKRQLTWFKRYPDMHWLDVGLYEGIAPCVEKILSII